ncbi:ABC-type glycerol-3-phosphate transport system, substrate-binding protein [Butyrivibrio hungatei]|uniref:ABC-type glycerol-3-phosphate transport system, substrate-binding protein n=1 Tax=Butyrivibrio hungatei TaxID=185008 RepID=A0A1G5BHX4_9FIRM|nr:extracellular solute-binding protein [Butyrivibrio hungatei]SCX89783.1 ABC-type glycerol-3-phosphate transport system, substrate-binding protein [Butyrivibrio hungatei]
MRNRELKRIACCIIVFALGVTSFLGCGNKNSSSVGDSAVSKSGEVDKEHVFKQKDLEGIIADGEDIVSADYVNGKIMLAANSKDGKGRCISFNPDGTQLQAFDTGCDITACAFDGEGNAYLQCLDKSSGEDKVFLGKFDPTGKELFKADVSEEFSGNSEISGLAWSEKYGLISCTPNGVQTYDEKNGFGMLVDKKAIDDYAIIYSFIMLANDRILMIYHVGTSESNVIIDLEKKSADESLNGISDTEEYSFFTDADGNLFAVWSDGVYKYDPGSGEMAKLLDFRASNIDSATKYVGGIKRQAVALNDTDFVIDLPVGSGDDSSLLRFTKENPADISEKTAITLGTMFLEPNVQSEIMKFNRSNDKYEIKVIDYSELYPGDGLEEAKKQLDMDIISGKAPDIINIDGNVKKYVDKGIFLDLTPEFDKGGALEGIELLPNIAEMMKYDGKMYTFMPSFKVATCAVRAKFAKGKGSLTYKELDDLIKSNGTDYEKAFGSNHDKSYGNLLMPHYADKCIDWNEKKCDFKNPEFIEFLNFINKFPDKVSGHSNLAEIDKSYAEDKGIYYRELFSNLNEYARLKQLVFNDDIELVGYPNNSRENIASIYGELYAVNSNTAHKDIVLEFVKNLILSEKDDSYSGFSTVKQKFEEELQEATKEKSDDDESAQLWDQINHVMVKMKPLSQEEVSKFYDYTVSINSLDCMNNEITNIIAEEASAFYCGQKTAEEVADIIQNRVTVYINENS